MHLGHTILSTRGNRKFCDRTNRNEKGRNAWRISTVRPFCSRETGSW